MEKVSDTNLFQRTPLQSPSSQTLLCQNEGEIISAFTDLCQRLKKGKVHIKIHDGSYDFSKPLSLVDCKYVENLSIEGNLSSPDSVVLRFMGCDGIVFDRCTGGSISMAGLKISRASNSWSKEFKGITITNRTSLKAPSAYVDIPALIVENFKMGVEVYFYSDANIPIKTMDCTYPMHISEYSNVNADNSNIQGVGLKPDTGADGNFNIREGVGVLCTRNSLVSAKNALIKDCSIGIYVDRSKGWFTPVGENPSRIESCNNGLMASNDSFVEANALQMVLDEVRIKRRANGTVTSEEWNGNHFGIMCSNKSRVNIMKSGGHYPIIQVIKKDDGKWCLCRGLVADRDSNILAHEIRFDGTSVHADATDGSMVDMKGARVLDIYSNFHTWATLHTNFGSSILASNSSLKVLATVASADHNSEVDLASSTVDIAVRSSNSCFWANNQSQIERSGVSFNGAISNPSYSPSLNSVGNRNSYISS